MQIPGFFTRDSSPRSNIAAATMAVCALMMYAEPARLHAEERRSGTSGISTVSFADNGQSLGSGESWYVQLADLNGDGVLDAYFEGAVWLNDGRGHFSRSEQSFGPADRPAFFADLNGDGFVDAVCDNKIYLNDGKNHFEEKGLLPTGIPMLAARVTDLNGDGHVDIIVAGQIEDRILLNDGKGTFVDTGTGLGGWSQCTYAIGDVNGDSVPDVYVGIPHTPPPHMAPANDRLWLGDGKGGFLEAPLGIQTNGTRGVVLADLSGDGRLDLFVTSQSGGSKVYLGDGKAHFVDSGQLLGTAPGGAALTADFNGDGFLDVFVARGGPMDDGVPNLVWLNDGTGRFTDSGLRLGNANSMAAAVDDLNGDGKLDVFVANVKNVVTKQGAGVNEVWLNTSGTLPETGAHPPPSSAVYLQLQGAALGEVSRNSAAIMTSHVAIYVDRLRESGQVIPEQATALMAAGKSALDAKDYYEAYRLQAKALGCAFGEAKVEQHEVAASFAMALNRALFSGGETITLTLRPEFTLGHALANRYTAQTWIETESGVVPGTDQTLTITELKEYRFEQSTQALQDGVIAVCYRLVSPTWHESRCATSPTKSIRRPTMWRFGPRPSPTPSPSSIPASWGLGKVCSRSEGRA